MVTGQIRGEPYAAAAWSGTDHAGIFLGISGLDTPTPNLDTFEQGALVTDGALELTEVALSGELMTVSGTFSGTVRSMGSGETIEITDGSFAVADIPRQYGFGPGG